jgi:hypothetical protein
MRARFAKVHRRGDVDDRLASDMKGADRQRAHLMAAHRMMVALRLTRTWKRPRGDRGACALALRRTRMTANDQRFAPRAIRVRNGRKYDLRATWGSA